MSNNPILFNAVVSGVFGGVSTSRSFASALGADYATQVTNAAAFATLLDAEIAVGSYGQSDADLLGSIVQQVVSGKGSAGLNMVSVNAIIAAFNAARAQLDPSASGEGTLHVYVAATSTKLGTTVAGVLAEEAPTWTTEAEIPAGSSFLIGGVGPGGGGSSGSVNISNLTAAGGTGGGGGATPTPIRYSRAQLVAQLPIAWVTPVGGLGGAAKIAAAADGGSVGVNPTAPMSVTGALGSVFFAGFGGSGPRNGAFGNVAGGAGGGSAGNGEGGAISSTTKRGGAPGGSPTATTPNLSDCDNGGAGGAGALATNISGAQSNSGGASGGSGASHTVGSGPGGSSATGGAGGGAGGNFTGGVGLVVGGAGGRSGIMPLAVGGGAAAGAAGTPGAAGTVGADSNDPLHHAGNGGGGGGPSNAASPVGGIGGAGGFPGGAGAGGGAASNTGAAAGTSGAGGVGGDSMGWIIAFP